MIVSFGDQLGVARGSANGASDIGAVEYFVEAEKGYSVILLQGGKAVVVPL